MIKAMNLNHASQNLIWWRSGSQLKNSKKLQTVVQQWLRRNPRSTPEQLRDAALKKARKLAKGRCSSEAVVS